MIVLLELDRLSESEATDLTWQLLEERPPEANISHKTMPTRAQHNAYVRSKPHKVWCAILDSEGMFLGTVLLTNHNEIGIAILKEHQGKGHAKEAIINFMRWYPVAPGKPGEVNPRYLANINPKNEASIALFESLGFEHIQNTYAL